MKTLLIIILMISNTAFAMNPMEFQKILEFKETKENLFKPSEIYLLPISRNFDQGETDLCWIYATLNMLESASLVSNPKSPVEFSRSVLQYVTMKDRFMRMIYNEETSTSEGGIEIDAINLIHENGLDFSATTATSSTLRTFIESSKKKFHGQKIKQKKKKF
jgi:C1A family cysteine protease